MFKPTISLNYTKWKDQQPNLLDMRNEAQNNRIPFPIMGTLAEYEEKLNKINDQIEKDKLAGLIQVWLIG